MIKWFWRLYVAIALTFVASGTYGGRIEQQLFPIRSEQSIANVERTESPHELCWDWVSVKNRAAVSPHIDVQVETRSDSWSSSVTEKGTQLPWALSRAVGVGGHTQSYCTLLPSTVGPHDAVTVHQRLLYNGFLGAWSVPVDVPDVVSPGTE
jgi:hypothetical protein